MLGTQKMKQKLPIIFYLFDASYYRHTLDGSMPISVYDYFNQHLYVLLENYFGYRTNCEQKYRNVYSYLNATNVATGYIAKGHCRASIALNSLPVCEIHIKASILHVIILRHTLSIYLSRLETWPRLIVSRSGTSRTEALTHYATAETIETS